MTESKGKKTVIISLIITLLIAAVYWALFFGAGRRMFYDVALIFSLAWTAVCSVLLIKKWYPDKIIKKIIFIILSAVVFFNLFFVVIFPGSCSTSTPLNYGFQKKYTDFCGYHIDIIPEKLPENISKYSFFTSPGPMQAAAVSDLFFVTDTENAEKIKAEAEEKSVFSFDVKKYNSNSSNDETEAFKEQENYTGTLDFHTEKFTDGKIYLVSFSSDIHGPEYSYIIVSTEKNAVQFSDRGR